MSTDDFTTAARAEGRVLADEWMQKNGGPQTNGHHIARTSIIYGFRAGAEWGAVQEPSDAEVDAAALEEGTLTVLREGGLSLDQYDVVREQLERTRDTKPEAWAEGREMARRILTAARAARRADA